MGTPTDEESLAAEITQLLYKHASGDYESSAKMLAAAFVSGQLGVVIDHDKFSREVCPLVPNKSAAGQRVWPRPINPAITKEFLAEMVEKVMRERDAIRARVSRLEGLLYEALPCLKEAKRLWAPNTTNSDADVAIRRIEAALTPSAGTPSSPAPSPHRAGP